MSPRIRPSSRSAGFSMVEFFLVALILGVGLLGLAALTTASIRSMAGSRARDTATLLANGVLDQLALDGRLSSSLRASGTTPTSSLLATATDGTSNTYTDPATNDTTFDLQGQPSTTYPVFTVTWVRLAAKSGMTPAVTSSFLGAEVVVNVSWNEALKNPSTGVIKTVPRSISVSRYILY